MVSSRVAVAGLLSWGVLLGACTSDPERLCVPGASAACVGVGGCAGGQVCNAAGSGFGACACGMVDAGSADAGGDDAATSDADPGDAGPLDAGVADMDSPDLGGLACDPIQQRGCGPSERCAWTEPVMPPGPGALRCVPDGPIGRGGPCTAGVGGTANPYDDCARGLHCLEGACVPVCDLLDPATCGLDRCVPVAGVFVSADDARLAGLCIEACDPVTQLRRDGTDCGPDRGCYGSTETGDFVCVGAYSRLMHGDVITGPVYTNACAPGVIPFFRAPDGLSVACTALCRPVETHSGALAGAAGATPYACPDRGAASPPHECLFLSFFMSDMPVPGLESVGVCFDRTGRLYDADLDGTPDTPWPSCTELANTDTDGDGLADHAAFGCAPLRPGT